jgi:hypothetical protein
MLSTRIFGLACVVTVFVCLLAAPVCLVQLGTRRRVSTDPRRRH